MTLTASDLKELELALVKLYELTGEERYFNLAKFFIDARGDKEHREKLYERLNLDLAKDFSTFERLGNCGSASLPVTTAMAVEAERVKPGDRIAMLGIGSGINCTMLGVAW